MAALSAGAGPHSSCLRALRHVQVQRAQRLQRVQHHQPQARQLPIQVGPRRRGRGATGCGIGQRQYVEPIWNGAECVQPVVDLDGIVLGGDVDRHTVARQRATEQRRCVRQDAIEGCHLPRQCHRQGFVVPGGNLAPREGLQLRLPAAQTEKRHGSGRESGRFGGFRCDATRSTDGRNPAWRGDFGQEKGPGDESEPLYVVERMRIELTTSALRTQRSPS